MTNPSLNWLREVALVTMREKRPDQWLIASDLLDLMEEDGSIEIPGLKDGDDTSDEKNRKKALQQIGRRLGVCFKDHDTVALDGIIVERENFKDAVSRQRWQYRFSREQPTKTPPNSTGQKSTASALSVAATPLGGATTPVPASTPPDSPLLTPLINLQEPSNPPNGSAKAPMRARDSKDSIVARYGLISGSGGLAESQGDEETPTADRCTSCGSTEVLDIPVHNGKSLRRDCARCGRTLKFSQWNPN